MRLLPVFTLAAWILIRSTPVVTSVDGKVRVASHWSNGPLMDTEALTVKVIAGDGPVTTKTGTSWAGLANGSARDVRRQKIMSFMRPTLNGSRSVVMFTSFGQNCLVLSEMEV